MLQVQFSLLNISKKFHRSSFNWIFGDLYEAIVDEYGLAAPLYFTIIKF